VGARYRRRSLPCHGVAIAYMATKIYRNNVEN
jgi:hypothetical protein